MLYYLDASTGSKIWNYTTGGFVYSSPALADGKVYVGSYDFTVYCLDAVTGSKLWSYKTGGQVYSSPAVADEKVYIASKDWTVYAFWSMPIPEFPTAVSTILLLTLLTMTLLYVKRKHSTSDLIVSAAH